MRWPKGPPHLALNPADVGKKNEKTGLGSRLLALMLAVSF